MQLKEIMDVDRKLTGSFYKGLLSILTAFNVISGRKGFLKYFIFPFLLNAIILSATFYFSYSTLHPWLSGFLQGDSYFLSLLRFLLSPVLVLLLGIITILIYSIIGNIVTAPFNDFLSLKVEEDVGGENFDEKISVSVIVSDVIRIASNLIKLLGLLVLVNLLLLLLNFLPLVGSILYSVLSFMMTAFFFGFQFFDFPLERRRLLFRDKLKVTWRFKFMVMGLGASFFLISFIPVVGFLSLNLATIGATALFMDHIKPVLKIERAE